MTATATKTRKPRKDKGIKRGPRKTAASVKAETVKAVKGPKAKAAGGTCLFSGEPTLGKKSRFLPGYDAKLKSVLLKVMGGEAKMSDIPSAARKALVEGPVVGFRINANGELYKSRAAS